jgi:cysteinyl-tRNA synthetase
MQSFGETYEIHGGASELMFPHHEAEIAQAEALTGKTPFVKFWLHTGLLTVGGRKMSKSLGNVVLIRDALKDYHPQELRWFFASYHYREPVIMSKAILKKSTHEFHSFRNNIEVLRRSNLASGSKTGRVDQLATNLEQNFRRSMDSDFYTPGALKSLSTYAEQLSKLAKGRKIDARSRERAEALLRRLGAILGIEI